MAVFHVHLSLPEVSAVAAHRSGTTEQRPGFRQIPASDLTNAGIARCLWWTERTVESHVRTILAKLDPRVGGTAGCWLS